MIRHKDLAEVILKLQVLVELNVGRFELLVERIDAEFHVGNGQIRATRVVHDICAYVKSKSG